MLLIVLYNVLIPWYEPHTYCIYCFFSTIIYFIGTQKFITFFNWNHPEISGIFLRPTFAKWKIKKDTGFFR